MRQLTRYLLVPCAFLLFIFLSSPPLPIAAHPLGNFSVNRYSRLMLTSDEIRVFYVVDMAEVPAFQLWPDIDINGDDLVQKTEKEAFASQQTATIAENLQLAINGRLTPLTLQTYALNFPPGQGELLTLRLEATYVAPLSGTAWDVAYSDNNFEDRLGWQEIVVQMGDDVALLTSTAPTTDMSQALSNYPDDLMQSPPDVRHVTFQFEQTGVGAVARGDLPVTETAVLTTDRFSSDAFAQLITITNPSAGVLMAVLLLAFALGAVHALSPGHGKTIVGAYLIGSRGTAKHALFLGLTTTITHTIGVFALGFIVLFASRFILPEQLYPWLSVLSGLLVLIIGFSLLRARWQQWRHSTHTHHHHDHHHDHDHHHHDHHHHHDSGEHSHFGIRHSHTPPETVTWRGLLSLGISGGLLPCPSALVLLLSAIALQRVAFGLLLIGVFSLGLASVLTGIGLLLVYAGQFFERFGVGNGRVAHALPLLSALFITLAGVGITIQALSQIGIL